MTSYRLIWAWGVLASLALSPRVLAADTTANLVADPQFDHGVSGFEAQDASSLVARLTDAPIEGAASLRVDINGYGNNVWWSHDFIGGRASELRISVRARSDVASSSHLQVCAMAYFADDSSTHKCTAASGAVGDKGIVAAALPLDATKVLQSVHIRLYQEGSQRVSFALDNASAVLDVVAPPPSPTEPEPGPDPDPGPDPGPQPAPSPGPSGDGCTANPNTSYPGFTYQLPTVRPYISLHSWTQASSSSTPYQRLQSAANQALAGNAPWGWSPSHSLLAHVLIGQTNYMADAISRVEAIVTSAEAAIAAGNAPDIADDSYLHVGWYMEQIALVYDRAYGQLTPAQRQRWAAIAEQSLFNVWNPQQAQWGGHLHAWTGWSVCDPGNNYHYSFLRATMLWALASQNQAWFEMLQTRKFGPLVDYYAALQGGGTREGTGYGSALGDLFGNYVYWKDSTGENLAGLSPHTRETIDYWVHATVPTRDHFAPIGDQSRESVPALYDYQEKLVHEAVVLSAGTPQARRGTWWLQNNSVNGVQHAFNLPADLLSYPDTPEMPTELVYHSPGAGALFARTGWGTDATWIHVNAGRFDQSHAHQDQGSFTFFKGDWLAVTNNIWSKSGIHQELAVHNTLRFERADGSTIGQNHSGAAASSMKWARAGATTTVAADLRNAYSSSSASIQSWLRTFELSEGMLRVTDTCSVAAGITPVFQVQTPGLPVLQADGSILAGDLHIVPVQPVQAVIVAMNTTDFWGGYRVDLRSQAAGCSFIIELRSVSAAEPDADQ